MSESEDIAQLTFPEKLWYLVNEPKCRHIEWGAKGMSIVITDSQEFSKSILNNPSKAYFKTKNLTSFVRQLNLYGFRKVTEHKKVGDPQHDPNRCEFKHPSFRKGKKDLLEEVKRQPSHSKKEESPSEEKPHATPPNQPYPAYYPVNSMSSPYSMWTNWDAYLQAMGLFPYLPTVSSPCGFADMPSPSLVPEFYGREATMGPAYGGYIPPFYQLPPHCAYTSDMCMMNTNGIDTVNNESKPVDSSSVSLQPTVKVTPSKSSVVIINNTLSSSRDVPGESGCYGKCDVARTANNANSEVYVYRGGQEAKKPIPAQKSEVSTCTKTGAAQAWRKADSRSPLKPAHKLSPTNNTKIKVTERKPADEEKRSRDGAEEKEMDSELQSRRKRVCFEMNGPNQG